MIRMELEVDDVVKALGRVRSRINANVPDALDLGADLVAAEARNNHDYEDQTGELTNSIQSDGVTGSLLSGNLEAHVAAGAPHAAPIEFGSKRHTFGPRHRKKLRWEIEGGFAFADEVDHPGNKPYRYLGNALDAKFPDIVQAVEDAVDLSFAEVGLP